MSHITPQYTPFHNSPLHFATFHIVLLHSIPTKKARFTSNPLRTVHCITSNAIPVHCPSSTPFHNIPPRSIAFHSVKKSSIPFQTDEEQFTASLYTRFQCISHCSPFLNISPFASIPLWDLYYVTFQLIPLYSSSLPSILQHSTTFSYVS